MLKHYCLCLLLLACPLAAQTSAPAEETLEFPPLQVQSGDYRLLTRGDWDGEAGLLAGQPADVGRSLSWLGPDFFRQSGADSVEELLPFVPGAYGPARFGNLSVPDIRGDAAESFLNGQRRSGNLFGYRPVFNGVEALEVLRGPGTVVQGQGRRTGGLVNFLSKRADPEADWTQLSGRLGTWVPGDSSYLSSLWQLDTNRPLSETTALRLSYEGQADDTFYDASGARNDHQDVYAALRYAGRDGTSFDLYAEYLWQEAPQLLGVNRPSQQLIDDGLYLRGRPDPELATAFPVGPGEPGLLNPGPDALVPLDRAATLFSPGDYSRAEVAYLQGIWQKPLQVVRDLHLVNRTLLEHVDRERAHAFAYAEAVEQLTFENRTELHFDWLCDEARRGVVGVALRYEGRENYTNYWNEFAYVHDLSQPGPYAAATAAPYAYLPGREGPGGVDYFSPADGPFFATPETVESTVWNPALFWEQDIRLHRLWKLSLGARWDYYEARAEDPLPLDASRPLEAERGQGVGSYSAALLYQPNDTTSAYLSWSRMQGLAGNTVGDGVSLYVDGEGRAYLREEDFQNRSQLLELGLRQELAERQLALSGTLFYQERDKKEFFFNNSLEAKGVELDLRWQPQDSGLTLFANGTWMALRYVDSAPAEFGGSSIGNVYAPGTGPEGLGNGLGYLGGFFLNSLPPGDYRVPGVSRWRFSGGLAYGWDSGWRTSLWGTWQSEQTGNLRGEFVIPAQYELNATLAYNFGRGEIALDILNLTDEDNWVHNGDTFFNNLLISRNLPRRLELRGRWGF